MSTGPRENSKRFLSAFNDVERHLRRLTGSGPEVSFRQLVKTAARKENAVARSTDDLGELAGLRNAIVHQSKDDVIAEPHTATCDLLDRIACMLLNPPLVLPRFQRDVVSVEISSAIGSVVTEAYRHSFSQFPVLENSSFVGVMTTNTVVRWLGANASDDVFSLEESTVREILEYNEFSNNYEFVNRETDLFRVLGLFQKHDEGGERLDAVLISHNGKSTEKMLGIISPWDLPAIHSLVALS